MLSTVQHCLLKDVFHILLYTTFIAYDALGNTGETKLHGLALNFSSLCCTELHSKSVNYIALYCTVIPCTALHNMIIQCTALHCTVMHYTALDCTVP